MNQAASAIGDPAMAWLAALRNPQISLAWSLTEWEHVVRLSRRLRLLGRLAEALDAENLLHRVPEQARRHLLGEQRLSRWRRGALVWTQQSVGRALSGAGYPRVLLKGAAYLAQDLPIAAGRLPSDLDILVPHAHVADAQARLTAAGWMEREMDVHDQRYYREWSHELPPMTHALYGLELDLHHNILPPVARTHVDAALLFARLQASGVDDWLVLHPQDQVLHSAAHLFLDSESRDRLRDLVDLDGLFRHFGRDPNFWAELPARALELGLAEPLALACHFAAKWLATPVPADALGLINAHGPSAVRRAWLLPTFANILTPTDPDVMPSRRQGFAATFQLMRYHRQRLPMRLLLPHLWHKAMAARRKRNEDASI